MSGILIIVTKNNDFYYMVLSVGSRRVVLIYCPRKPLNGKPVEVHIEKKKLFPIASLLCIFWDIWYDIHKTTVKL